MLTSGHWPETVALTSALREEGVTHTALALGAVLAMDTSKSVCLLDTNWYWPALPVVDSPGLAAVLDGEVSIDDALVPVRASTGNDEWGAGEGSLSVMPAGRMAPARRVTAARGPELKQTFSRLRTRFDYLLLDTPAVLATSDAIALAGLADACCLVVHQGATPAATVQEALAAIRHLNVVGVIMNQVRVDMPAGLAGQLTQG
jgi:Mrp family chromosome partitioning ATPase